MIQSYKEEIHTRRNRAAVFWLVVFGFSCVLYMFFEGYYFNASFFEEYYAHSGSVNDRISDQKLLKRFGIVNLKVEPEPDSMYIAGKAYSNGSSSFQDRGDYRIESYRKGYVPIVLNVRLNNDFPIFYDTLRQLKIYEYYPVTAKFDSLSKLDSYYLAFNRNDSSVMLLDSDFKFSNSFLNTYKYIGYKYFSDEGKIFIYNIDINTIVPFMDKKKGEQVTCASPRIFHDRLFCDTIMDFIDGKSMEADQEVLMINENLILTRKYVFNNGNGGDWGTHEFSGAIMGTPENVIHIFGTPSFVQGGKLFDLSSKTKERIILPELDTIRASFEFGKESILLGRKGEQDFFLVIDEKRKYLGKLDRIDTKLLKVYKMNGVYYFNTGNDLYAYYKGGEKIYRILTGEQITFYGNVAVFKKNGNWNWMPIVQE